MAAGIGSRYGGGIKQLAQMDEAGHIIMDYSIHDAIDAGFDKVVFIIRKDIKDEFYEVIGKRIDAVCHAHGVETAYAFQELIDLPEGYSVPEGRTKPWGTGQAVLAAKDCIDGPFVVINADDYYGKEAFKTLHDYLVEGHGDTEYCMAGFILKNTLSDNGGVTRGVCSVDENDFLTDVNETSNIVKTADGAEADGKVIDVNSHVSMNMWGLSPAFMQILEDGFVEFLNKDARENPLKSEYLLPILIGDLLQDGKVSVKVLETQDKWFGVTYAEDKDTVVAAFADLIDKGVYTPELYDDLKD